MQMKTQFILLLAGLAILSSAGAQKTVSQKSNQDFQKKPLPAKGHYQKLTSLSSKKDPAFAWMDTIVYPAKEHATGSLAATKLRTAYLIDDVPSLLNIPLPPANSSEQTRAELAFLRQLQEKRTAQEVERYQQLAGIFHSPNNFNPLDKDYDRNFSSLFHVGKALGEWYTYKNLPKTAKFLSNVYRDAMYYVFNLKLSVNRPRPYMLDTTLKYLERPQHASYPSGHSSASFANAYIMSDIAPELADTFLKRAEEMALSREVLGVHYPSDSEMGRIWARNFVNQLFLQKKFRDDFAEAKKEILEFRKNNSSGKNINNNQPGGSSDCSPSCESSCSNSCCKN
jgi:acid phosphatase (class A)